MSQDQTNITDYDVQSPLDNIKPLKITSMILVLFLLALFICAWMCRYTLVTAGAGGQSSLGSVYKLDRWTGEVEALRGAESYKIRPAPNQ